MGKDPEAAITLLVTAAPINFFTDRAQVIINVQPWHLEYQSYPLACFPAQFALVPHILVLFSGTLQQVSIVKVV